MGHDWKPSLGGVETGKSGRKQEAEGESPSNGKRINGSFKCPHLTLIKAALRLIWLHSFIRQYGDARRKRVGIRPFKNRDPLQGGAAELRVRRGRKSGWVGAMDSHNQVLGPDSLS